MKSARRTAMSVASLLSALTASACSDLVQPLTSGSNVQLAASQAEDIIAVQNRHTPDFLQREGIVGTGIRLSGSTPAIAVYAVSPSYAAAARIPSSLEGYPVEVVVTGRIDATDYNNARTLERPVPNGFSVGHPDITAGTIGARVTDGTHTYILSNNHVLANTNAARIGDPALQPGPYDGGTLANQIGTLADFQTIVMGGASNTMDAAIARVNGADALGATPTYAYGAPGVVVKNAQVNMAVQKFGRTTGHTTGSVSEINVTVSVCYVPLGMFLCKQAATFVNQIGITPGTFSAGGDSGSLIVTNDGNKNPVGLLFAGSSTRTLANPIGPVLTRFGVQIDTGTGSGGGGGGGGDPGEDTTAPTASFSYSCGNSTTCSFTDTSSDNVGVTAWSWDLGNKTSSLQNTSTTYTAAGSYPVSLTVQDAAGNSSSVTRTVTCAVRGKTLRCS